MAEQTKQGTAAKKAGPKETPREKFVRLANLRANKVIVAVDTFAKLGNGRYEYTPEDVEKLFGALRAKLDAAEQAFQATDKKAKRAPVSII